MIENPSAGRMQWLPILYGLLGLLFGAGAGVLVVGMPDSLKLIVIVVGIFAFAGSIMRVDWGLLVLVFITYTRFSDIAIQYHGAPSLAKSFVLLLFVAIFFRWIVFGERVENWQRTLIMMSGYGLVGFFSIFYADDPIRAQDGVIDFIKDALIVVIVSILLRRASLFRWVVWTLLIAGIFMGTLSVFQYATGTFDNEYGGFAQAPILHIVGESDDHRVSGPIGDPNYYSQIMVVMVPLALERFWKEKKRSLRLLAGWAAAVSILSIVFSFSRGGFLALVVVLGLIFIYRPPKIHIIIATLIVAVMLLPFIPAEYTARIATITNILGNSGRSVQNEASFRGRASEVIVAWMMFRDNPILGVGYGNFPVHYQEYSRLLGLDPRTEERAAHNLYLEVAAELGIFGLIAFGFILWKALGDLFSAVRTFTDARLDDYASMAAAFTVGLIGYLSSSMFIHNAYPRYLWLLLGIALALRQVARNELAIERNYRYHGS